MLLSGQALIGAELAERGAVLDRLAPSALREILKPSVP
jgi:hypothetical protein